jgi:hypothetical protein
MAQIDPSIALGVRPVQIENPLAVQGRAMEGAVNALKYQDLQRATQEEQEVRNFLRSADLSKPETRAQLSQFGKTGLGYGKLLAEQEKVGLETKKLTGDISKQQLEASRQRTSDLAFNPSNENIIAHLQDSMKRGEMNQQQATQLFAQVANMPLDQRKQTFLQMGADATKRLEQMSLSEFQKQNLGIQREGQRLQYDPTTQANIAGAKKRAETEVTQEAQGQADVKANRKALATAGYDPVTGKDNISKLIQDSTGSFAGAGTDLAGRLIGVSTKGAQAISQLKTFESKLTQDILGGKLGAGISNTDREFIVQAIGEIANSTLPVETRQAAWNAVKERMRVAGMVEAPKAPANNVNVPGVGSQVNTPGSGAAPASKPTLDSIFGTSKK